VLFGKANTRSAERISGRTLAKLEDRKKQECDVVARKIMALLQGRKRKRDYTTEKGNNGSAREKKKKTFFPTRKKLNVYIVKRNIPDGSSVGKGLKSEKRESRGGPKDETKRRKKNWKLPIVFNAKPRGGTLIVHHSEKGPLIAARWERNDRGTIGERKKFEPGEKKQAFRRRQIF